MALNPLKLSDMNAAQRAAMAASGVWANSASANSAAMRNAFSSPIQLAPAAGSGKINMPVVIVVKYTPGSIGFLNAEGDANANAPYLVQGSDDTSGSPDTNLVDFLSALEGGIVQMSFNLTWKDTNQPLMFKTGKDWIAGTPASVAANQAGSGYQVGDQIYVSATGYVLYEVTSVDGGGGITGIQVLTGLEGEFENPGTDLATDVQTGSGTGATLDVTVNPGDGSVDFRTLYMAV